MSQAGIINVIENNPNIPIVFDGNTGSATALFNVINIVGDGINITTNGSGNTLTISFIGTTFAETITGQSGGALSPTAGNWNIFGGSTAAGTTPVSTSGAVSTLTVNVQRSQAIAATDSTKVGLSNFNSSHFSVDANGFVSLVAAGPFVTSVSGTANRITSTGGTTPVIDISAAYVGQTSITTLGTVTTGVWNGTAVGPTFGGTGITTYTTGDTLYASAANTLSKLPIGSASQVLTVTAGIPSWQTPTTGTVTSVSGTLNRITSTGGATPVIDIAATYVGQTSITTLGTVTTGTWNATKISEGFGGTNQSTYVTGDILYASGVNTLAKLPAGSNTQVLTLAAGVPTWASPVTSGTVTTVSVVSSNGFAGTVANASTTPAITLSTTITGVLSGNGTAISGSAVTQYDVLVGGASNAISSIGPGSTGQVLQSGGNAANPAYSTATYPSTAGSSGKILISDGTNIISSTPTYPNSATGTGKILRADGTNWVASTATYPDTSGTSGNVLTSNGTNWTSAAPAAATGYNIFAYFNSTTFAPTPADSTTYYFNQSGVQDWSPTQTQTKIYILKSGTITAAYIHFLNVGANGSSETSTVSIRLNNSTDTTISSSVTNDTTSVIVNNTALSISVNANDFINVKWVTPFWATNPTQVAGSILILVT